MTERLVVDPLACEAVGICAHLAPDLVRLDRWGYPVLPAGPLSARDRRSAATAVAGCPRRALLLVGDRPNGSTSAVGRSAGSVGP